jgi:hypothetical protein
VDGTGDRAAPAGVADVPSPAVPELEQPATSSAAVAIDIAPVPSRAEMIMPASSRRVRFYS